MICSHVKVKACTLRSQLQFFTLTYFVDLDILIRLDVEFATLQRFFNYSILARLDDFVDLDILINLKIL